MQLLIGVKERFHQRTLAVFLIIIPTKLERVDLVRRYLGCYSKTEVLLLSGR
jgi:hypothetical protein